MSNKDPQRSVVLSTCSECSSVCLAFTKVRYNLLGITCFYRRVGSTLRRLGEQRLRASPLSPRMDEEVTVEPISVCSSFFDSRAKTGAPSKLCLGARILFAQYSCEARGQARKQRRLCRRSLQVGKFVRSSSITIPTISLHSAQRSITSALIIDAGAVISVSCRLFV